MHLASGNCAERDNEQQVLLATEPYLHDFVFFHFRIPFQGLDADRILYLMTLAEVIDPDRVFHQ